jgi:molecular chaperone HscB
MGSRDASVWPEAKRATVTVERAQAITQKCWRCHEPVGGPVCSSCATIQPPRPDTGLFALLGIERAFFFENADLERAYRALSRKVHPDRFARKSAVERRMSLQWTAAINEARRVLKDPVQRARYLATGQAEAPETGGPVLEPDFLEQIFELQLEAQSDPADAAATAQKLRSSLWSEIEGALRAWESGDASLDALPEQLARLKYIDNIVALATSASDG